MGSNATILLVEDNEDDVFLMTRAFKNAGVELNMQVVVDGQEALDYLAGTGVYADRGLYPMPALIFLDIKLPQLSGLEVLRWLRENSAVRRTIVIVLTSSNHPEDVRQAYDLGANSYIVKPASYQQLVDFVKGFKAYWLAFNKPPA
jgi:CheY-like chemotaxis protein